MADTKTSLESAAATLDGTELYRGVQAAANVKVTGAQIATQVLGISVAAQTGKTTPVDADVMPMSDSAASNVPKKVTWANIKATLKTYFDTLYALTGAVGSTGITMSTARLLGRSTASTGAIEEITLGTNLSFTGTTLNAAGGSPGGSTTQVQYNNAGAFAGSSGFTYDATNNAITLGGATVTTSNPVINTTQTWNAGAVTFTGWKLNVTNTASAAGSLLTDWQVNGTSVAAVTKAGRLALTTATTSGVAFGGGASIYGNNNDVVIINSHAFPLLAVYGYGPYTISTRSDAVYGWSSTTAVDGTGLDTGLARNAAGVVEVNNSTAGTFRDLKLRNLIVSSGLIATDAAAPTIASAGTIAPTTNIAFVSGTTTISTITAPSPISAGGGQITLIPTGLWVTNTAGNIALATTAVVSKALTMTYDVTTAKWYPSY